MTSRFLSSGFLSGLALIIAAPVVAAPGSVRDFQLRPTPAPTATPEVQGPVDTEGPVRRAPRVIPTDRPLPEPIQLPTQNPSESTATPVVQPTPSESATPRAQPQRQAPAAAVERIPATPPPVSPPQQADESAQDVDGTADIPAPVTTPVPSTDLSGLPAADETSGSDIMSGISSQLWWLLALIAALVLVALVWWKRSRLVTAGAPEIEPPLQRTTPDEVPPAPLPEPAPLPRAATAAALGTAKVPVQVKAEAHSLSRSVMNATLALKLDIRNLGTRTMRDIIVKADMVTAHGKAPMDQQLATAATDLSALSTIAELAARDTQTLTSELRLPVSAIKLIPQGRAFVYVPLLRIRIEAEGKAPVTRTFVIGNLPPQGQSKLQPFRLDEMAQTYRNIGLRALD